MSEETLQRLREIATRRDREPDLIWPAALAAAEILVWQEQAGEARDLAMATIADFGRGSAGLAGNDTPLPDVLLWSAIRSDEDPVPLLRKAAEYLAPESLLGTRLVQIAESLSDHAAYSLLLGAVSRPDRPFTPREQAMAARDAADLSDAERTRLWVASFNKGKYSIARRLLEGTGHQPPRWPVAYWMAARLVADGEVGLATDILIRALPLWHPLKVWNVLPITVVMRPELHPAFTSELHAAGLARVDLSQIPGLAR
ncbi:hypothetical protein [Amycolatopsis ultiminotia]